MVKACTEALRCITTGKIAHGRFPSSLELNFGSVGRICGNGRGQNPGGGGARRLRRGSRACSPMGRSIASVGDPKVSKGERREAGIQWIQPPKAVSDPEFRQTTSGAHGSANRADCLPRGKPFGAPAGAYTCIGTPTPRRGCRGASGKPPCLHEERQLCRKKFPLGGGLTRRLRREWMGLPPRRGIVLSFDAKESTKESVRHGDSGKKPFIAHFDGGARYVARSGVG